MRKSLVLASLVVLVCSASAFAGVPDPTRSGCALSAQTVGCQWRFQNDGNRDKLTLCVTIRDTFGAAVPSCSTYCNLANPSNATINHCGAVPPALGGARRGGLTDAGGVIYFIYRCIGGNGSVDLNVTTRCATSIGICSRTITLTNANLDGDADTDVTDLGNWAGGYPPSPYAQKSDYDCDLDVDFIDLGFWAGGYPKACALCP